MEIPQVGFCPNLWGYSLILITRENNAVIKFKWEIKFWDETHFPNKPFIIFDIPDI